MSRLHELAERMGVETHHDPCADCYCSRSDLEIAHDMLAKLPRRPGLSGLAYNFNELAWCWYHYYDRTGTDLKGDEGTGTFIECVCELASRHK